MEKDTILQKKHSVEAETIRRKREIAKIKSTDWQFVPFKKGQLMITYDGDKPSIYDHSEDAVRLPLYMDKELQMITPEKFKRVPFKTVAVFPDYLINHLSIFPVSIRNNKYIIIDAEKFMESKGINFCVKAKCNMNYREILSVKKSYCTAFKIITDINPKIREIVGSVYPESNYDIIYCIHSLYTSIPTIHFVLSVKIDDITITNSIEIERYLGSMTVQLRGIIDKRGIHIVRELKGTRITYKEKDILAQYTHSHLPGDSERQYNRFCIGHENHMFMGIEPTVEFSGKNYSTVTELELESILMGIDGFIRWESLEGGPHRRLEQMNVMGSVLNPSYYRKTVKDGSVYTDFDEIESLYKWLLQPEHMDDLLSVFTLQKKANGFRYEYDFIGLLLIVREIANKNPLIKRNLSYYYDSESNSISSISATMMSADRVKKEVASRTKGLLPSYMNREIIKPVVEADISNSDYILNIKLIPHPAEIRRLGNAINRFLNNELKKNEYKRK